MKRHPKIQKFIDDFAQRTFGRVTNDPVCVTCGSVKIEAEDFRDDLSRKEFSISHMCQECQDSVFGGGHV